MVNSKWAGTLGTSFVLLAFRKYFCQRLYVLCAAADLCAAAADQIVSELGVLPAGDAASSGAGAEVTVTVR